MTALVCVLMGCGIPTTANYIIMVTVAAPTLVLLGVQPLVAHFFVFYYGVLADITPPVALAAYAAAGMAGSDPFKTGNTAFRLGLGKALVPFVFVFAPSMLLVTAGFSWEEFAIAFGGCVLGITFLAAALSDYFLVRMRMWERWVCGLRGVPDGRARARQHADRARDGRPRAAAPPRVDETPRGRLKAAPRRSRCAFAVGPASAGRVRPPQGRPTTQPVRIRRGSGFSRTRQAA